MAERGHYLGQPWHYADGKTEAQRGQGGGPHAKLVSEPRPDPDLRPVFFLLHPRSETGSLWPPLPHRHVFVGPGLI